MLTDMYGKIQASSFANHSHEAYSTVLWLLHRGFQINPQIKLRWLRHASDDYSVILPMSDCQRSSPKIEAHMMRAVVTVLGFIYYDHIQYIHALEEGDA